MARPTHYGTPHALTIRKILAATSLVAVGFGFFRWASRLPDFDTFGLGFDVALTGIACLGGAIGVLIGRPLVGEFLAVIVGAVILLMLGPIQIVRE